MDYRLPEVCKEANFPYSRVPTSEYALTSAFAEIVFLVTSIVTFPYC